MTQKLTFKRGPKGDFDNGDLRHVANQLRALRGYGARVPEDVRRFATERLISETWKLHNANPSLRFDVCAQRVALDPAFAHLYFLDRLDPVGSGERDLDAEIEDA